MTFKPKLDERGKVIVDFLTPLVPKEWRGIFSYDSEWEGYRMEWDWFIENGKIIEPDKMNRYRPDAKHYAVSIKIDYHDLFEKELDPYQKAIYIFAHREDPPIELSEFGKHHLQFLAEEAVKSAERVGK